MRIILSVKRSGLCRAVCSTLLMAALITSTAPLSARPGGEVPFRASFDTQFQVNSPAPILNITVQGEGHALHMGRSETSTNNQVVNLITGAATATYTVVAANGDTVVFENVFNVTSSSATAVTFEGTYDIIGGIGRFAGAAGSGILSGSAHFTAPTSGVGEFTFEGTISSPGRK